MDYRGSGQASAFAITVSAIAILAITVFAIAILAVAVLATSLGPVPGEGYGGVELFRLKVSRSGLGHTGK